MQSVVKKRKWIAVSKIIGVIGGMGPMATWYFCEQITRHTLANTDQEHVHVCVDCNTNIPDRTEAILRNGASPVPELVKSANRLQQMDAGVLVMPCVTAHHFYDELTPHLSIPLLNMLREAAREIKTRRIGCVGLLATDGTLASGICERQLAAAGIKTVVPSPEKQKHVMQLVYEGVKAGSGEFDLSGIYATTDELSENGAQVLLLGCTELPVAFAQYGIQTQVVDPLEILAKAAIRYVGASVVD